MKRTKLDQEIRKRKNMKGGQNKSIVARVSLCSIPFIVTCQPAYRIMHSVIINYFLL